MIPVIIITVTKNPKKFSMIFYQPNLSRTLTIWLSIIVKRTKVLSCHTWTSSTDLVRRIRLLILKYDLLPCTPRSFVAINCEYKCQPLSIVALIKTYIELNSTSMGLIFLKDLLIVAMEPAGWFLSWSGLEKLIITPEKYEDEISFFERMSKAEFHFVSN